MNKFVDSFVQNFEFRSAMTSICRCVCNSDARSTKKTTRCITSDMFVTRLNDNFNAISRLLLIFHFVLLWLEQGWVAQWEEWAVREWAGSAGETAAEYESAGRHSQLQSRPNTHSASQTSWSVDLNLVHIEPIFGKSFFVRMIEFFYFFKRFFSIRIDLFK